jgi:MFS family permease
MNAKKDGATGLFFGWRVVWAAFAIAIFGWGTGYYGPSVLLYAVQSSRGWSVTLVATAISMHFLVSALVVANLASLHRRLGVARITRAAAISTALGILGWAMADQPWQLFAATLLTGFGWAGTGSAAINTMVSPWFVRRRVAALTSAYNGASLGGVLFPPIWVGLIASVGFVSAAALVGATMVLVFWVLAGTYLARSPSELRLAPDADAGATTRASVREHVAPVVGSLWRNWRFRALVACASLSLAAQIGLVAHLYSLLVPAFGEQLASFGIGLGTICAMAGGVCRHGHRDNNHAADVRDRRTRDALFPRCWAARST